MRPVRLSLPDPSHWGPKLGRLDPPPTPSWFDSALPKNAYLVVSCFNNLIETQFGQHSIPKTFQKEFPNWLTSAVGTCQVGASILHTPPMRNCYFQLSRRKPNPTNVIAKTWWNENAKFDMRNIPIPWKNIIRALQNCFKIGGVELGRAGVNFQKIYPTLIFFTPGP